MALRINTRRWASALYVVLLALIGVLLYARVQTPEGSLLLSPGSTEHAVVIAHEPDQVIATPHRNLSTELLPLENPRAIRFLDTNRTYDAIILPFGIRLDHYEVLEEADDTHELIVHSGGELVNRTVVPGDSVPVFDEVLEMVEVVPWEGLIRHERGRPMVHLTWTAATPHSDTSLFLERDAWYYPDAETSLQFQWHDSEAEARQVADTGREALRAQAQWGVRDGGAVQWMQSLTPGSGLTLRDGTQVLFVRRETDGSAITLQVTKDEETTRVPVSRNVVGGPGPYYYQDPAGAPHVIRLHGWDEGQVVLQHLEGDTPALRRTMAVGDHWVMPDGGQLRLDHVMSRAVPLTHAAGGLSALVFRHGEDTLRLREGVVITSDSLRLEYRRTPQPPAVALHLTTIDSAGETMESFSMAPGTSQRLDNWMLTWEGTHVGTGDDVVLTARRHGGRWALSLGLGLAILGTLGLAFLRSRTR